MLTKNAPRLFMTFRFIAVFCAFVVFGCASDYSAVYEQQAVSAMSAPSAEEAVKIYEASVKKRVTSADYYEGRGDIYYKYGEFGSAVNEYTYSLRNIGRADVHMKRGRAYMNLRYFEDAVIDFNTVVAYHNKDMYTAVVERAKAYIELGRTKEALRDLESALKRAGESQPLFVALAEAYIKLGQTEKAKEYVQKAIMMEESASLYLVRGRLYYKTKDANQAIKDYTKALELEPKNLTAKLRLANIYATCPIEIYRDGKKAVAMVSAIYETNRETDVIITLASAYAETGDFDRAADLLAKGIEAEKDFVMQDEMRVFQKAFKERKNIYSW